VSDALVTAAVQINNGSRVGTDRFSVTSGRDGLFTIDGHRGKSLGMIVSKPGYEMVSTNSYFIYSHLWSERERHHPNPQEPTLLRLHRLKGSEPLNKLDASLRTAYSNIPFFFDVFSNQFSKIKGDLRISVTRSQGTLSKKSPGDWSVSFEAVDGGILETDFQSSRVALEAPEAGYANRIVVSMKQNDSAWMDNVQKVIYLKSRGGSAFSKFRIEFMINIEPDGQIFTEINGFANLNGSRNWEDSFGK
jgi:hypothetical protein